MNLQQFRHLLALQKVGSFKTAALDLGITQQALSRSIRALEEELDALLIERHARGLRFTEDGVLALESAADINRTIADMRAGISSGQKRTSVTVGVSPYYLAGHLSHYIQPILDEMAVERVQFVHGAAYQLAPQIASGEVDFAFTSDAYSGDMLRFDNQMTIQWGIAARQGHPIFDLQNPLDGVGEYGWVSTPDHAGRKFLRDVLQRYTDSEPRIAATSEGVSYTFRLLERTDLICFAPIDAAAVIHKMHGLQVIPLEPQVETQFGILRGPRPPVGIDWPVLSEKLSWAFQRYVQTIQRETDTPIPTPAE
jgi:DNA-binding transcriptional LysR family regulator